MEGGSAINSKSGGGSFGTKGSATCFRISCCFSCVAVETFWTVGAAAGAAGSTPGKCVPKWLSISACPPRQVYHKEEFQRRILDSDIFITLPLFEVLDFMLIVCMIRVAAVEEIEFRISQLVLPDSRFELGPIPCDEARSLVDDIWSNESR